MKSSSTLLSLLLLAGVAAAATFSYLSFQRSGNDLANQDSTSAEAYVGNTFPPFLIFDSKPSFDKGCFDLKWSSINSTRCTSNWRPEIITSGTETLCQGKIDHLSGVRNTSNIGEITYAITCTGPAGSVSKSIKVKN